MEITIKIEDLTKAIQKIKGLVDDAKNIPGVMFDISDDTLKVCYSDGKSSLIEKISILNKDSDIKEKIVLPYKKLVDTLDMCQSSGNIKTNEMRISFTENKSLMVEAIKYLDIWYKDDAGETVSEQKVVSRFKTELQYNYIEDSIKFGILSRMDYESIFKDSNGGTDDFDEWDKARLKEILTMVSAEKSRTVYVSSKMKAVTVANLAMVIYEPVDNEMYHGFTISTKMAKSLADILGKVQTDTVRITTIDKYTSLTDSEGDFGIWFEMVPGSKTDIATLQQYRAKEYKDLQLVFSKSALINVLGCALNTSKDEKNTLTFDITDEGCILKIVANNASSKDTFDVMVEGKTSDIGDLTVLKETQIPISLKVLNEMIKQCAGDYIAIDIDIDTERQSKFIRVGNLLGRDDTGNKIIGTNIYTTSR